MNSDWKLNFDVFCNNSSSNVSTPQSNASCSPLPLMNMSPEVFVSKASGNGYPILYVNGCRKYGPPINWEGPEPSPDCELFIKDVPRECREHQLIPHFERFGRIYEFRLMMDYDNNNRGYAYVRYTTPEEAALALNVMKHFLLLKGQLSIHKSYHKCRLFVSNLPKDVSQEEIVSVFKSMFPTMSNMVIHSSGHAERAFGFLDFPDHKSALEAKKLSAPGYMDLFNREIKIVWAFPERQQDNAISTAITTLFIRNIGLAVTAAEIKNFLSTIVPKSAIRHISTVRDFAFVEFTNRNSAEIVKDQMNGKTIKTTPIEIEWARPPSETSVHTLKKTDFDAELRLTCIANYWDPPIFVYGRAYEDIEVQVVTIIVKQEGFKHYFFIQMSYKGLVDIQSRCAEIVTSLIFKFGFLPREHLVIKAEGDFFAVVGLVRFNNRAPIFVPSGKMNKEIQIFWEEIYDMALMVEVLGGIDTGDLFSFYQMLIKKPGPQYLEHLVVNGRVAGCFNPINRNKPSLKIGLQNQQIILVLCDAFTKSNVLFMMTKPVVQYPLYFFYSNGVESMSPYLQSGTLLPLRIVQGKRIGSMFDHVIFGSQVINRPINFYPQINSVMVPVNSQLHLHQMPLDLSYIHNLPPPLTNCTPMTVLPQVGVSHSAIF